jgi:hypothetical protein
MDSAEKRRFKRVTITSIADIMSVDVKEKFRAFVGGISRGGMEIYAQKALRPGNEVRIWLHFIDINGKEAEEIRGKAGGPTSFRTRMWQGWSFRSTTIKLSVLLAYLEQAEKFFA